jgi:hypothetical protein
MAENQSTLMTITEIRVKRGTRRCIRRDEEIEGS